MRINGVSYQVCLWRGVSVQFCLKLGLRQEASQFCLHEFHLSFALRLSMPLLSGTCFSVTLLSATPLTPALLSEILKPKPSCFCLRWTHLFRICLSTCLLDSISVTTLFCLTSIFWYINICQQFKKLEKLHNYRYSSVLIQVFIAFSYRFPGLKTRRLSFQRMGEEGSSRQIREREQMQYPVPGTGTLHQYTFTY